MFKEPSARIYRSSFGRENDRFRENKQTMVVFSPIFAQRRRYRLVLEEIILGGGFQILELRRGRDPLFSCPKSGHIRLQIFIKFIEFAIVECSSKDYTWL